MYNNKLNREKDDDLKFIPLNIKEPFLEKDSSWLPMINMDSPNINGMANNFMVGFSLPVKDGELNKASLESIDDIPNINYNDNGNILGSNTYNSSNMESNNFTQGNLGQGGYVSNGMLLGSNFCRGNGEGMSNSNNQYNGNFNGNSNEDFEFPSQIESENLYSYNKDTKCKPLGNGKNVNMNMNNNVNTDANSKNIKDRPSNGESPDNINNIWNVETENSDVENQILGTGLGLDLGLGLGRGREINGFQSINNINPLIMKNNFQNDLNNNPIGIISQNIKNQLNGTFNNNELKCESMVDESMLDSYNFQKDSLNYNEEFDEPLHMGLLRKLNLGSNCENVYRNSEDEIIDKIFRNIEEKHHSIFETLKQYNVPYPLATVIVRNTIKLALENSNKE